MLRIISNLKNKRGFTLIELIVVLAVLAIILAIAIPRFVTIQDESRIKADVATAEQIIKAARLMEARRNDGNATTHGASGNWDDEIMAWPKPESGDEVNGKFTLSYDSDKYSVSWKVEKGSVAKNCDQEVIEGEEFKLNETP